MKRFIAVFLASCACSPSTTHTPPSKPATLERTTLENLTTVTLTDEAEKALGLEVAPVIVALQHSRVTVGGEVMVPAGREIVLSAPVGGRIAGAVMTPGASVKAGQVLLTLIPLATVDRDVRARAQRELDVANADLELAQARFKRAESMVSDRSGSVRVFEDARAQRQVAEASVASARARLQTLSTGALDADVSLAIKSPTDGVLRAVRVAVGQSVPAGAALVEVASSGRWVRATLSAGDARRIEGSTEASATRLGASSSVTLAPTNGPPSADVLRGTLDVFYVLPAEAAWAPGERVVVEIATNDEVERPSVPLESVLRDAEGGTWVYVRTEAHHFRRHRIEVLQRDGQRVVLARGPKPPTPIVTAGAVELWGFELGADR